MATTISKTCCIKCHKEKATLRCGGCLEEFCYKHLEEHRQELNKQLDDIEVNHDLFRQSLIEQINEPKNHVLIKQIDTWEYNSIKKIQQTAIEAKELLLKNISGHIHKIEIKLNELTNQLRHSREEDDFNEINLHQFQEELNRLIEELTRPSNFSIREESTSFISNIYVDISDKGGGGDGNGLNQLGRPWGLYVDDDQTMYIADTGNDRILKWTYGATHGEVVAGENGQGQKTDQLHWPVDVIIDKERDGLIICDQDNRRVVRWPRRNGTSGQTIISNIDCQGLAMDNNGYLYVLDHKKHEVRRWKMNDTCGILVADANGRGNHLNQLNNPTNIFVDEDHSVYVSDYGNHRVIKWMEGANEGNIVAGGNGQGKQKNQLNYPMNLKFDRQGNLYIVDFENHRIQIFNIDRNSNLN